MSIGLIKITLRLTFGQAIENGITAIISVYIYRITAQIKILL